MAIPVIRTEIKRVLIITLWVVFGAGYFTRFPLPGFISKLYFLSLAALVAGSAWGFGSLITEVEEYALATLAGFGMLSFLMFLLGVIGEWNRFGAMALIVSGLFLARRHCQNRHSPQSLTENPWIPCQWPQGMTFFCAPLFLIALGAVLSLLIAFTPVTYYDSLVYHLALPQAYVQAGHWIGRPELIYSAFPQMMEMIWTMALLLAGDTLANLLGWGIAVLGVLTVYSYARRHLNPLTALWAAALLSVMPSYLLLSSGGYIDIGLATFSFASFYALSLGTSPKRVALAGFFAGCALGCKYTGAVPVAIGALILLKETRSQSVRLMFRAQIIYAGTALLIFSPWLIKNIYYLGNPVFPFFYSMSSKSLNPWIGEAAAGYFRGLTEYTPRSPWQLLQLVWDSAVHGLDFGGGMDVLGDLGWAPLLAFLPAVWLAKKRSRAVMVLLLYSLCFFIPWGMSRPVLRFLLPLAPFLALSAAYGYEQMTPANVLRFPTQIFMALLLLSNLHIFFNVSDALSLFQVPMGMESQTDYLTRKLDYYSAASYINTLPEDSLTYVVGDQRGYYYNRPVLVTPVFNKNPLTEWANDASSAEDLVARLKTRHITHLLINNSEMARLDQAYHLFPFTPKGRANWDALRSSVAKKVYQDPHCDVLAL